MADTIFRSLSVARWRQFRRVDLRFSERVTILTGRNGTGKTSILNILAQHSQYSTAFVGAPSQARDSLGRYMSGIWKFSESLDRNEYDKIGAVSYSDDTEAEISVKRTVDVGFNPRITPSTQVDILNIPSHRRLPAYKRVETIPTGAITREQALQNYQKEYWSGARGELTRTTPLTRMKEAIVSMAVFGLGNERVAANTESFEAFTDFENRLRQIIPENIGFQRIVVNVPDVILETRSGSFLIDASSGGLMSLIDITWEISLFGREKDRFVVIIDEPENHLHPSMQREFIPALVNAFPEAQFIIATHSPFIVSSVKDAVVYAFDVSEDDNDQDDYSSANQAVVATRIDLEDRTTATEVLRKVLGVPITVPIWAERELDEVAEMFSDREISASTLEELREVLRQRGLDEFLPDVVARAVRNAQTD